MLTHRAIVMDARGVAQRFQMTSADAMWNPLPMFHGGGIMLSTACFAVGATFISQLRFDADEAIGLLERERVTIHYPLFPTMTLDLMHHPGFSKIDLSHARIITNVGPIELQRQVQDAYAPAVLMNAYGITELCGTVTFTELDDPVGIRLVSSGKPLPGLELRVVDPETNEPLPPGERGELVGRGACRFEGYYNNDEATQAVIDGEGFFHTGDIATMDEEGRFTYEGRLKDMLKVGGENVAALEIESYLLTHPAVKLAQVVGVPEARLVEVPAAFVELHPGEQVTEDELIAFCKGKIAGFKVPRYVRIVDDWPMSATKIQKFRLRDMLTEELER